MILCDDVMWCGVGAVFACHVSVMGLVLKACYEEYKNRTRQKEHLIYSTGFFLNSLPYIISENTEKCLSYFPRCVQFV